MKYLLLPVVAVAAVALAAPASAMCQGDAHKDQTAETPQPEPIATPSG